VNNEADEIHTDLIRRVAAGDESSFEALYDFYSRSLYSLGLRFLHDRGRAEELVQETMIKVWRSAGSFDPSKGRVSSWVFTVARRTAVDLIRKGSRTPVPVEAVREVPDVGSVDEEWRSWEIGVLLASLPQEQRTAVEMFVIEGYTQAEVAASLDVPIGTIKTRIYTGLKRLRERLESMDLLEVSQ
jgi:RNA polymerase sigma-70 factor (ECF subfamily)